MNVPVQLLATIESDSISHLLNGQLQLRPFGGVHCAGIPRTFRNHVQFERVRHSFISSTCGSNFDDMVHMEIFLVFIGNPELFVISTNFSFRLCSIPTSSIATWHCVCESP